MILRCSVPVSILLLDLQFCWFAQSQISTDEVRNADLAANALNTGSHSQNDAGCCGEVLSLRARIESLEQQMELLNRTIFPSIDPTTSEDSSSDVTAVPDYYKIKDKAPERLWFSLTGWLSVSFDVYAGDRYLGEFRQSMPWMRLIWDEMCFYDRKGQFQGQLYHGLVRWFLGIFPNPFFGDANAYLKLADKTVPLRGAQESYLGSMFSAERRSLDFVWNPSSTSFKIRKTNELQGQQEWMVIKASGEGNIRVAEIEESVTHDLWGRRFRGFTVTLLAGNSGILSGIVPGYFAAFDLAEAEDLIPKICWTVLFLILGLSLCIQCK